MSGDQALSEELTQETLYKAFIHIDQYEGRSSIYTWLCGIAKKNWLAEMNKQKFRANQEISPEYTCGKNFEEAIYWGVVRITFIFGPMIIQGFMDTTSGALRGLGVSISNTIISLFGICGFRILWCMTVFQIPKFHTPQALFIVYPISWTIISILQFMVFVIVYNKQKRSALSI